MRCERLFSNPVQCWCKLWELCRDVAEACLTNKPGSKYILVSGSSYPEALTQHPPHYHPKFMSDWSSYGNQFQTRGEGSALSYLAMLEGPGVHFVHKWDCVPLNSCYVPRQKKGKRRQDSTAQSKAITLFSVLPVFRVSYYWVIMWKAYGTHSVVLHYVTSSCFPVLFLFRIKSMSSVV